jgi:hypothetical protein
MEDHRGSIHIPGARNHPETSTVSRSVFCVYGIMTCQLLGGTIARAVVFAVLQLETRYSLSPAAWHRLKFAAVLSAHGVPSLKAMAFNAYFTLVRNIESFRLTPDVTYSL